MPCTGEVFNAVCGSQEVKDRIIRARQALAAGDRKRYDAEKRGLPMFSFMCTFMPNQGKDGSWPKGTWRNQHSVRLNGLVMLDLDHLPMAPREAFATIPPHMLDTNSCTTAILLAHVTPSGQGLRLVCTADVQRGTIEQNQQYISRCLGSELEQYCDKSCKNADRVSFAVTKNDIIYLNNEIFNYDNPEYDQKFGDTYRRGGSAAAHRVADPAAAAVAAGDPAAAKGADGGPAAGAVADGLAVDAGAVALGQDGVSTALPKDYRGTPWQKIVDAWLSQNGAPVPGERHQKLLRMAGDLRYLCDNNPAWLRQIVALAPYVKDMLGEGADDEVSKLCTDACGRKTWMSTPRRVLDLMAAAGISDAARKKGAENLPDPSLYDTFYQRLKPLLAPPYDAATYYVDDANKLGAVFASGTMFCTLMTRCHYLHYDGEQHRMNPQTFIIGDPAAGKSFADRLDRIIMGALKAADRPGREAEAEYKRKQQERATSSKEQKGEALKRPTLPIRYLPSRTSNAIFYRRLQNAVEETGGDVVNLHLYTFDSELDSNTTAQSGGAWIGKHDLELKAFHNEYTGVDYANSDSVNDILPVFYNTVCTGTPISLARKITLRNVNDGYCSRIAVFRMLPDAYKMVRRGKPNVNHEKDCELKQWAFRFDQLRGEMNIGRLVDYTYDLCEQSAFEAEASSDRVLDYLRKRAVFYAQWLTVPRIAARAFLEHKDEPQLATPENWTVTDDDLRFAQLMYDAVIYWQDRFFGQMLEESWENAAKEFMPRKRRSRNDALFATLPQNFTPQLLSEMMGWSGNAARRQCERWEATGLIQKKGNGYEKKSSTVGL